ncbi:alpha/beta hydrolase [Agromyces sp. G08B096]|uniref:Alpha/beta hydrolase n=1 Tax=Agromyces sp. G08B096 TaxID=3156399 RepID=A0AAU7W9M9_9MICO
MNTTTTTATAADLAFVTRANASAKTPVLFVHGLWLHATSWQPWVERFDAEGFVSYAPGWPGEADTVAETRRHPERVAGVGIEQITERYRGLIAQLDRKPILVGHSFGGLIVQKLLGEGLGAAAVAIDPAQGRGVYVLPPVQLRNALPVLGNPFQFRGANAQSQAHFAQAFGNAISREESDAIHEAVTIPSPGRPLFESATANVLPNSPAAVRVDAERGPLLIIGGGLDRTVPAASSRRVFRTYRNASTITEYKEFADRGHSLVLDSRWPEIAAYALGWLRFVGVAPASETADASA